MRMPSGADDQMRVRVNGRAIVSDGEPGSGRPDEIRGMAVLERGWNTVVVRTANAWGPWGFYFRLVRRNGASIDGLKYDADFREEP